MVSLIFLYNVSKAKNKTLFIGIINFLTLTYKILDKIKQSATIVTTALNTDIFNEIFTKEGYRYAC